MSNTSRYSPTITPTPFRSRGKTALITGGGRGIGRAIAVRLAQEGASLAIVDKNASPAEETVALCTQLGVQAAAFPGDVSSREDVERAVMAAAEEFRTIDILVNNAGIITFGSLMDCKVEDWNRMMAIDLTGAFHFTQVVGQLMIQQERGGRMLHIGSTASLLPTAQQAAYSVAKAGLLMMSKVAALELVSYNITSNVLCPQGAVTDINRELLSDPTVMDALEDNIPAHRMATVEEIAAAAAFLVSDEAAYITGTELIHDGGSTISSLWWR